MYTVTNTPGQFAAPTIMSRTHGESVPAQSPELAPEPRGSLVAS
jgi:hypothetical protein